MRESEKYLNYIDFELGRLGMEIKKIEKHKKISSLFNH